MSTELRDVQAWVDAEEAARFVSERVQLHVSARTLLAWAKKNRVPHLRLVGRVRFNRLSLEAWLASKYSDPPPLLAGSQSARMT